MSSSATSPSPRERLARIVAELQPLAGARLQRLDVVDERELVLELRLPGRTLRLLASARTGAARVHLVDERPERVIPHGPLQAFLRQRLVGQKLARLQTEHARLRLVFENDALELDLRGGRKALQVLPGGEPAPPATPSESLPDFALSEEMRQEHEKRAPLSEDARLRDLLRRALVPERKKLSRLEKNLLGDLDRLSSYQQAGHHGELLKTVLHAVKRGDREFEAKDWSTGELVRVALDPRRSPQANLQKLFDRAKKATRGRPRVEARLEEVWTKMEGLDRTLAAIPESSSEALRSLLAQMGLNLEGFHTPSLRSSQKPETPRPLDRVARRFAAKDGTEIRVGRGAAANDRLTFSFSKGDDLWLHARGTSGAHVVLRVSAGGAPSEEALIDAAHLAVHHSSLKNETKAEVMVAEVRHVKKTKGAAPGLVGVAASKTLLVRMESERIDRLYGRAEATERPSRKDG